MEALLKTAQAQRWHETIDAQIAAVISNRPEALGLQIAQAAGVATAVVDHRHFDGREAFERALIEVIDRHTPELVVLAGFMRVLTPLFVGHYAGRLINIHPSLLPSFTGLHTHARALAAGAKVHGATVHFVTSTLDHGPLIAQAVVPVSSDDTEALLAARVLRLEHRMLPCVVQWYLTGQLEVTGELVRHRAGVSQAFFAAPGREAKESEPV